MQLSLKEIRDYTGADDEFIVKLFDKFLEHIHTDISKLKQKSDEQNWDDVKRISHQMLSSARIFALNNIITLHEEIEQYCNSKTTAVIPEKVKEVIRLYEVLLLEIAVMKKQLQAQS